MWKEIARQERDRETLITSAQDLSDQTLIRTETLYKNRDGSMSLCSDTIAIPKAEKPEKRSAKAKEA